MSFNELNNPIPVILKSKTLPNKMTTCNMKGIAIAIQSIPHSNDQWLVVLNETGECVWVPMPEIQVQECWSDNRRFL